MKSETHATTCKEYSIPRWESGNLCKILNPKGQSLQRQDMKLEVETACSAVLHCNTTPSLEFLNNPIFYAPGSGCSPNI